MFFFRKDLFSCERKKVWVTKELPSNIGIMQFMETLIYLCFSLSFSIFLSTPLWTVFLVLLCPGSLNLSFIASLYIKWPRLLWHKVNVWFFLYKIYLGLVWSLKIKIYIDKCISIVKVISYNITILQSNTYIGPKFFIPLQTSEDNCSCLCFVFVRFYCLRIFATQN